MGRVRFSSKDGDTATVGQIGWRASSRLEGAGRRLVMQRTEGSAKPMIDVLIPEGALKSEAEARLVKELTDILITHEGFEPATRWRKACPWYFSIGRRRCSSAAVVRERRVTASSPRCRKGNTTTHPARRW